MRNCFSYTLILLALAVCFPGKAISLSLATSGVGQSKEEAVQVALAKAVQAAGSRYVLQDKSYLNGDLVSSDVSIQSSGVISTYQVLKETELHGTYYVTIQSDVEQRIVDHASDLLNQSLDMSKLKEMDGLDAYQRWLKKGVELLNMLLGNGDSQALFNKAYITQISDISIETVHMNYIDVDIELTVIPDPIFWDNYEQLLSMLIHKSERKTVHESAVVGPMVRTCGKYINHLHLGQSSPVYEIPRTLVAYLVPPLKIAATNTSKEITNSPLYLYKNSLINNEFYVAMDMPTLFSPKMDDSVKKRRSKECGNRMMIERALHIPKKSAFISEPFHYVPLTMDKGYRYEDVRAEFGPKLSFRFKYRGKDASAVKKLISSPISKLLSVSKYIPRARNIY